MVTGRREPGIALIAGGVGVAPLLGILRQLHLEGDQRPTTLLYGNRIAEQIVYQDELATLQSDHGTNVVHVLSEPPSIWTGNVGRIDAKLIEEVFSGAEIKQWLFILCGPSAMMETAEDALISMGVPAYQILSERFSYD